MRRRAAGGRPSLSNPSYRTMRDGASEQPHREEIARGQMSIVGPRPALEYELEHYAPTHVERFRVPPGLTGLWQVSGRSTLSFTEMRDARILLRTPPAVLRGRTS